MAQIKDPHTQTLAEERLNALTHGVGALMGIAALVLLIVFNTGKTDWSLFSVIIYGLSIIILFSSSTLYHAVQAEKQKHYFRIIDHISIYLLIAGTYTPVALIALEQSKGWPIFWVVWGIALLGLVLKLFFTGKFELFSVLLYLIMGWLIVIDFSNLADYVGANGTLLLFAGGLFYTLGIVFYAVHKIPYNHVIWHLFVLGGAICHFLLVFFYVI
ncbi:hemolysin III family protein [Xanthomarina sp. F1114]|uniref:PAQR family membrane homeostasis protein TrhA n=1 Tax=Xanthomarina sp. F1114 TaxID=2996019 RepID=UPI00225E026C|nr:hemolysin III family protein [Xanthomarina sp. F1114]MCX7548653.1 hemolysin III family protein [Xanthomarina sp. F1114]